MTISAIPSGTLPHVGVRLAHSLVCYNIQTVNTFVHSFYSISALDSAQFCFGSLCLLYKSIIKIKEMYLAGLCLYNCTV